MISVFDYILRNRASDLSELTLCIFGNQVVLCATSTVLTKVVWGERDLFV